MKAMNLLLGTIVCLGLLIELFSGRVFEGGAPIVAGGIVAILVFGPVYLLTFFALSKETAALAKLAFWWNLLVLIMFVAIDGLIFYFDPNSSSNPVALLIFQLVFLFLPLSLNVTTLKRLIQRMNRTRSK